MFPAKYFAKRYFPGRYFEPVVIGTNTGLGPLFAEVNRSRMDAQVNRNEMFATVNRRIMDVEVRPLWQ